MRLPALILLACGAIPGCAPAADSPSSAPDPAVQAQPADLAALPGDSIYQLNAPLTDQDGRAVDLSVFAGQPVLISMFYASCPSACPMLIGDIERIEAAMTPEERAQVRVLLISLDPANDTPAALKGAVEQYGLDAQRWRLAAPRPEQVREIAAVLGISYQQVQGGELHHSSIITLLDRQGRPLSRTEGLRQPVESILEALRRS